MSCIHWQPLSPHLLQLKDNPTLSNFFQRMTYSSFKKLADAYVEKEASPIHAPPTVFPTAPELVKLAFTYDFTAKIARLSQQNLGHITGLGNRYLQDRFEYRQVRNRNDWRKRAFRVLCVLFVSQFKPCDLNIYSNLWIWQRNVWIIKKKAQWDIWFKVLLFYRHVRIIQFLTAMSEEQKRQNWDKKLLLQEELFNFSLSATDVVRMLQAWIPLFNITMDYLSNFFLHVNHQSLQVYIRFLFFNQRMLRGKQKDVCGKGSRMPLVDLSVCFSRCWLVFITWIFQQNSTISISFHMWHCKCDALMSNPSLNSIDYVHCNAAMAMNWPFYLFI